MADDESRGVHLSDKQLVFAFMAAIVATVVVFLFGVLVGRGVQQARGPIADDAMTAAEVVPDGAGGEAPAAAGEAPSGSGARGPGDLSYPERLGISPPAEHVKAAPPPVNERARDSAPPEVPAEPLGSAPVPAGSSAAGAAAPAAEPPAAARYTVQVAAVKRRDEADGIVKQLKAKGYDAYVFVPAGDDRFDGFRVRIGSFKDKRQADALAERLLRDEKRYKPWVTR
jgi:cell division septation protein DedD